MSVLTSGFTGLLFAPTSDETLASLFFQDPDLLVGPDLTLTASTLFKRVKIEDLVNDSVIVLLQDIVPNAIGEVLPGPIPGISGKATPAVFYQQRSSTPLIHVLALVADLHGTDPLFPATCQHFPAPKEIPTSFTVPHVYDGYAITLTSIGVDLYRNSAGNHFKPVWDNTFDATPPHPIKFVENIPVLPASPMVINSVGLVNAASSNPLFQVGAQVPSKSIAAQKSLFENISFWYWWNGQDMPKTIEIFGGAGNLDVLCPASVDAIMSKMHTRFQNYPIFRPENIQLLIRAHWSKVFSQNTNKSFNSLSICLFTDPNADGTPHVFKKISSKLTDPFLVAAISDLFEIILTCFTPNKPEDIHRSSELLARVSIFMNALSTVGNIQSAHIDVQVELINNMFYNLFHIPKNEPFLNQKIPVPDLTQQFFDKVTETLHYSTSAIQAITSEALHYPDLAKKQFGATSVPATPTKKQKGKQSAAAKKKAKLTSPTATTVPSAASTVSSPPTTTVSNSVHCVNHAASLLSSQWPAGAPVPAGCHPTNGKPCTRQHSMTITPGIPIANGLVTDLLNGVEGFRNAKAFASNFKITLNGWH